MHACTELCIYEGVSVFLCFNVCCFYCFVAYHDETAACMFVPVWGHLTNTMNVDIVKSVFFFLQRSLVIFLLSAVVSLVTWKQTNDRTSMTVILGPQTDEDVATINYLLVMDWFRSLWISSLSETKPAWTIWIISGGNKKAIADIDQWAFVKGICGTELPEELGLKTCNFSVNTVFVLSAYRFVSALSLQTLICDFWGQWVFHSRGRVFGLIHLF